MWIETTIGALVCILILVIILLLFQKKDTDITRVKKFVSNLRSCSSLASIMKTFVSYLVNHYSFITGGFILFYEREKITQRVGFNVSSSVLDKASLSKNFRSELNKNVIQLFSKDVLDLLNIPSIVHAGHGLYGLSFKNSLSDQSVYIFLLLSKDSSPELESQLKFYHTQVKLIMYEYIFKNDWSKYNRAVDEIEQSFTHVIEYSPSGFILLDTDGRIMYLNSIVSRIFDSSKKNFESKFIFDLLPDSTIKETIESMIKSILQKKEEISNKPKVSLRLQKQILIMDLSCYPIYNESKDIISLVLLIRDRTKQYRLEEELHLTQEVAKKELESKITLATKELVSANKELQRLNDLKSEFVSTISHELRTPLTSIKGYISLFTSGKLGKLEPVQLESLQIVKEEADRLHNLINDVLDLSKLESGKSTLDLNKTDLPSLAKSVVSALKIQFDEKDISVRVYKKGKLNEVFVDESKLKQVLVNLLSNSIKFTPVNGKVSVHIEEQDHYITIVVKDSGKGMVKEKLDTIFDPFVQIKHKSAQIQGTGLGLAIVKNIIDLHNGKISVDSIVNEGTTFTIHLPKK